MSLTALGLVIYYFVKVPTSERLLKFTLALVMAGALGNLFDRVTKGYVVDFLDFYIGSYHWPAFNIADSAIFVGAALLIVDSFRQKTH
jgi:signal peptidase II